MIHLDILKRIFKKRKKHLKRNIEFYGDVDTNVIRVQETFPYNVLFRPPEIQNCRVEINRIIPDGKYTEYRYTIIPNNGEIVYSQERRKREELLDESNLKENQ